MENFLVTNPSLPRFAGLTQPNRALGASMFAQNPNRFKMAKVQKTTAFLSPSIPTNSN
jgi:hypothetical protein